MDTKAKGKKDKKEEVLNENEKDLKIKQRKENLNLGILKHIQQRIIQKFENSGQSKHNAPQWAMARVKSLSLNQRNMGVVQTMKG